MIDDFIRRIVIVGGGTAGWMVAAGLSRALTSANVSVTLIESDEIGSVGVGEATLPAIRSFNAMLGLDERDLLKACHGAFKLGIEFCGWGEIGSRYMHPFAHYGGPFNTKLFPHLWLKYAQMVQAKGEVTSIDDYNIGSVAANAGRFTVAAADPKLGAGALDYAYHFDAALYGRFLRRFAEARGVSRMEGEVVHVTQDGETGFIQSVTLKSGAAVAGDFFIDCTGFRGLLIEQTLHVGYEDWRHWLPCDRAIAIASESREPPVPFTRSTADRAGWFWRIPLQSRVGNGHVYSSAFISDDEAETALRRQLSGPALSDGRRIRFVTGRRRRVWDRNCLAIGLAAGFLEPLESTSIHLIQTAILRLISLFPDKGFNGEEIREFNRQSAEEAENARDFIVAHYYLNRRADSEFWRHCAQMSVPDRVSDYIGLFSAKGRLAIRQEHTFASHSWMAILLGQGLMPRGYDPMLEGADYAALEAQMGDIRDRLAATVSRLPRHQDFITAYCASHVAEPGGVVGARRDARQGSDA